MTNYKSILERRFNDYELNAQISEELNKVMKKYDVRYLRRITNDLNRVIDFSERQILDDKDIEQLNDSLIYISNNLKSEKSLKIYADIIDELDAKVQSLQLEEAA